jgi:hypothetical protein
MMFKFLLGAAIALLATVASATDYVASFGANSITLRPQKACYAEVLKHIPDPAMHARVRAADVVIEGKTYKACFAEGGGHIFAIDEDGDVYDPIPTSQFRHLKDV